jgi:hypothetical protein
VKGNTCLLHIETWHLFALFDGLGVAKPGGTSFIMPTGENPDGQIMACGTSLKIPESQASAVCPMSTMKDFYALIRDADRVVSFR